VQVGDQYFYASYDSRHGTELWVTDGTDEGTLVKDIYKGAITVRNDRDCQCVYKDPYSSNPVLLTNLNGTLVFAADDGKTGYELWRSDGTSGGTKLVKDVTPGPAGTYFSYWTVTNGLVYFIVNDVQWQTDGTTDGTVPVDAASGFSVASDEGQWDLLAATEVNGTGAPSQTAARSPTTVNASGQALLLDGVSAYPFRFALAGVISSDGTARGRVNFVFGPEFSEAWGAVPGVDSIHLSGTLTTITVSEDGTIALAGLLTETDFSRGGGVAFAEEDVPFTIVFSPGSWRFTLQWCELPTFDVQLTAH
jgi:ELWxxDGT repeat protein